MRNIYRTFFILLVIVSTCVPSQAQEEKGKLIQFSGLVLTVDSLLPIPYATVKVTHAPRGTIANHQGFFSMVVRESDTIQFSAVGFKKERFIVPKNLKENKLKIIQTVEFDTLTFEETVIYPWPSKDRFKQAFLNLELQDDELARARRNLQEHNMRVIGSHLGMDAEENSQYYIQQRVAQSYYSGGQRPYFMLQGNSGTPIPGSLLSPGNWIQFFRSLKNGDFTRKREEFDYPDN